MKNKQVAVIVPVYKYQPNASELLSLNQCLKVLKDYPLIFVVPESLDTTVYKKLVEPHTAFRLVAFEDNYFKNLSGYNQLLLSPLFYKKFLEYKFILIHQLDAFVFKDELAYWCGQDYDYIGAPNTPHENADGEIRFLKGYGNFLNLINKTLRTNLQIKHVGNGGFSLRKTKKCYQLVSLLQGSVKKWGTNNEDGFFKYWGNLLYPFFKLPADGPALRFSVEVSPKKALEKLSPELPFGCHAFEKYDWETWKPYILKN